MDKMVQRSMQFGSEIVVGNTAYKGRLPQYTPVLNDDGITVTFVKTTKGLPFVRVGCKRK